jgi:hypothetical protein
MGRVVAVEVNYSKLAQIYPDLLVNLRELDYGKLALFYIG